jgi:hypothetical protein
MATYEEGILALKSCPETVALAVQENYNKLNVMPSWSKRDTFFVRSLFSTNGNIGLNFSCGDILCVLDTIYEDQVGNWYACKLSETGHIIGEGCIPNIQRASKLLDSLAGSSLQHESPFKRPRSKAVIGQRGQLHSTDCDVRKNQSRIGGLKECPVKCSVIYDSDIIGYRVATSAMTLFLSGTFWRINSLYSVVVCPSVCLSFNPFICSSILYVPLPICSSCLLVHISTCCLTIACLPAYKELNTLLINSRLLISVITANASYTYSFHVFVSLWTLLD